MSSPKLISQGSYGCTYYPKIDAPKKPVLGIPEKSQLSKLVDDIPGSYDEIEIGKILQTIPDYEKYVVPVLNYAPAKMSVVNQDDDCEIVEDSDSGKFLLLYMKYIKHKPVRSSLGKSGHLSKLFQRYRYLMKALEKLWNVGIVHFDLKQNNTIYDTSRKIPLLIDFGLSLHVSKIKRQTEKPEWDYEIWKRLFAPAYAPSYYIWSLDVHFLCLIMFTFLKPSTNMVNIGDDAIKRMVKDFIYGNELEGYKNQVWNLFSDDFKLDYYKCAVEYYTKRTEHVKTRADAIELFYNGFSEKAMSTWDTYSLSMMYLEYIESMYSVGNIPKDDLLKKWMKILVQNIHPNPEKRKTAKDTLTLLNEMRSR